MERLKKFDGKLLLITICTVVLSIFLGYSTPQDARAAGGIPLTLTITVKDSSGQAVNDLTVTLSKAGGEKIRAVSTGTGGQVEFADVSDFVDTSNKLSAILKIEYTDSTTGNSYAFENEKYEIADIINTANQTPTVVLPDYSAVTVEAKKNLVYNENEQELITATGAGFTFEYAQKKDGSYETFSTTSPKQKDAGTWIYGVKIKEGSSNFSEIRDVEAEIAKKKVTLEFEDGTPANKKWLEDPFTLEVKNNPDVPLGTTYDYSSSKPDYATVATTGKVTPVKPGTTEIQATFTDSNYDVTPAALNFTVNKADSGDVNVVFATDPFEKVYNASGTFSQDAKVTLVSGSAKDVTEKARISYSIESGGNTAGAGVSDSTKSEVTYTKIGEATVKASLENNDWFNFTPGPGPSGTYKAKITGAALPKVPYTIEGTKINDDTVADYDCFKDSFTIKPATDYQIAAYDSTKELKDQDFKDKLSYTETASKLYGKETIHYVLKDNAGNITDIQKVKEAIGIDQTAPNIERFDITTEGDLLYNLTFGLFGKSKIKVTVTAVDDSPSSGIADIKLYGPKDDKEIATTEALSNRFEGYKSIATKVFYIDSKDHQDNFGGYLWAVATDKADHSSGKTKADGSNSWVAAEKLKHGEGYFNIETIKPVYQNVSYVQNTDVSGDTTADIQDNGTYTTGANTKINFDLKDSDSGLKDFTIKANGEELSAKNVEVETNSDGITYPSNYNTVEESLQGIYKYTIKTENGNFYKSNGSDVIPPNTDGSYAIELKATDQAGNVSILNFTLKQDKTTAVITDFAFTPTTIPENEGNGSPVDVDAAKNEYGFFVNEKTKVTITAKDTASDNETASGAKSITYKAVGDANVSEITDAVNSEGKIQFDVDPNFKGHIYAYATDNMGQSTVLYKNKADTNPLHLPNGFTDGQFDQKGFCHPLGLIVENMEKHLAKSEIKINDNNTDNPYLRAKIDNPFEGKSIEKDKDIFDQNKEVKVFDGTKEMFFKLTVSDTYSGIKQVETKVFDGDATALIEEYHETSIVDSTGQKTGTWKKSAGELNLATALEKEISLDPSKFNQQLGYIQVILTDNAGNQSYNYYPFAIDKTNPTVDKFEIEHIHDKPIDKILNNLTFGLFFNEELQVTVITSDSMPSGGISGSDKIEVRGKTADDKEIPIDPVDKGFNEIKPSKSNGYTTTATKKYILPLEFDGYLYARVKDNAGLLSPEAKAVGPGEKGEPANTTVDGEVLADTQGYINLEAHVPNIFETSAENKASLVNDKEPNGQFTNDQVKQINGVHKDETFTNIDGRDYVTGDAELSFVVQDQNSGLREVTIEVNEEKITPSAVTINSGEKTYPYDYVGYSSSLDKPIVDKPFREKDHYVINTTGIAPDEKGEYRVRVTVTDNAGNVSTLSRTFYKDITAATVTDFTFTPTEHVEGTNKPVNAVETDYGYYFKEAADVTITATDNKYPQDHEAVSGLASITYVAKDIDGKIISGKDVAVDGNGKVKFTIPANFKGQIYAYATDKLGQSADKVVSGAFSDAGLHWPSGYDSDGAGNKIVIQKDGPYPGYVHPSGSIVENNAQHYETSDIQIAAPAPVGSEDHAASYSHTTQMDKEPAYDASQMVPLYNGGFNFGISVGDSYSGIREITWTVIEGGADQSKATVTVQNDGNLTGDVGGWNVNDQDENLVTRMSTSIPVSGNYNDMVLRVDLTDRSGNQSYDYYMFGIDTTVPTINVSYDNNNGDSIGAKEANHAYYNADRVATITVTERNFDPARVNVHATSNGGAMPVGLSWSDSQAGGNGDGSTHVAQIVYSDDADYTFTMDCMDRANWTNSGIDYGGSLTPENFTVDKTLPVVTVTYDNNDAANGKYFKANRTATITVQEHNFDVSRMTTQITAMLDGQGIGVPGVSWSGGGDTHYGTVAFNTDGDYTLNVTEARDAAGNVFAGPNYSATAAQDFTVDTKIEKPVIRGVENEHAYKDDFAIGFDILDINFDTDTIQLLRTRYDKKDEDVTADFLTHISRTDKGDVGDGNTIEKKQDYDGIYTLNLTVTDKATNTESATVTFSVNRFGSVYVYDSYLTSILDGYVKKVDQGLVITEYNPDRLLQNSLQLQATRDSAPMKDLRYTVSPAISNAATVGESGWYQYRYSINADNFDKDGIYAVTVASKDEAGNQPENTNYPDKDILFRVDSVAPELVSVTGLEKDTINAIKANVEYKAFDAIALDEVSVYVNNERVDYINTFEDLTTYSGKFSIGEGVRQNIRIVLKDKAGNVMNTADADFKVSFPFERTVTVSTNPFVRWFSNIYRTIGTTAVGVIAIGVCVYLLLKKGKGKGSGDNESTK